ncbi:MAG TPA: DUF2382 domain-containing protein [Candidatus Kurthia intestinigallinarum]|nr:DUF2382 domain-containing protein [Candidatus Kurthia intestinigallinarum]
MDTNNSKLYGIYDTEVELQNEMDRLREQGYSEEDMYIVSKRNDELSMYHGSADVHNEHAEEGSWWDRFKAFMMGEDSVRNQHFTQMGIPEEDRDRYYGDLEAGKLFLYVDKDKGYGTYFAENSTGYDTTTGTVTGAASTNYTEKEPTLDSTNDATLNDTAYNTNNAFDDTTHNTALNETAHHDATIDDTLNHTDDEEARLRLHEEQLEIEKNRVQTGEVQVDKHVVEEEKVIEVPVEREEVYIERRPVDGTASVDTDTAFNNGTEPYENDGKIHIPVSEEQIEVTKKDVVTEEIVVGKRKVMDTERVSETVRREEADITDTTNSLDPTDKDRPL